MNRKYFRIVIKKLLNEIALENNALLPEIVLRLVVWSFVIYTGSLDNELMTSLVKNTKQYQSLGDEDRGIARDRQTQKQADN